MFSKGTKPKKKRGTQPLRNQRQAIAARTAATADRTRHAVDADLAQDVRDAAALYNTALNQAKAAGLTVLEGLDTTNEAGAVPIHADPINITAVHRAY
jgi:hypothetical protein